MNIPLLLLGIVFLAISLISFLKNRKLLKEGVRTRGGIIDILARESQSQDSDGFSSTSISYYPVFEFKTEDGKDIRVEATNGVARKNKFKRGDLIDVIYEKGKPEKAKINNFGQMWSLSLIMLILGILMIFGGFVS